MIKEDVFPLVLVVAILAGAPERSSMFISFLMAGNTVGRCLVFIEKTFVAACAGSGSMCSVQRVVGIPFVIKANELPALLAMAGLALGAKCARVFVVFAVARLTDCRRFLFGHRDPVALFAGDEVVRAEQEVFRVAVMIERRRLPCLFSMAGLAFHPKDGVMDVVSSVAGAAVGLQFVIVEMAGMTAAAGHAPMLLTQREFCIPIMIKDDLFPYAVRVAGLALLAVVSFMDVVLLMARVTDQWCGPVIPIGMASFAIDSFVLAEQREFRLVVVKERGALPLLLRMALFARSAQGLLVLVVFLVTGVTGGGSLLFGHRHSVAAFAFRGFVFA